MILDDAALDAAVKTYDPTKPVYMLLLSKYRETADYAPYLNDSVSVDSSPCTGREAMVRYRTAIAAIVPPNTSRQFASTVVVNAITPKGETWDDVVLIKFPDMKGFREMVQCDLYKREVVAHRYAGLENSRLILLDETVE